MSDESNEEDISNLQLTVDACRTQKKGNYDKGIDYS
jgi:hypothetical protein